MKDGTFLVVQYLKTPCSQCRGVDSSPGQGFKVSQASQPKKTKHKKQEQCCNKLNKDFKSGSHLKKKRFRASTLGGMGWLSGQETKILQALQSKQERKKYVFFFFNIKFTHETYKRR